MAAYAPKGEAIMSPKLDIVGISQKEFIPSQIAESKPVKRRELFHYNFASMKHYVRGLGKVKVVSNRTARILG